MIGRKRDEERTHSKSSSSWMRRWANGFVQWARTFLGADPHGTGPFGDEYRTSTLYFDTAEGHVFHRWGSYGRAKYRIRRYGDSNVAFLERKLRRPGMLVKRRTQVRAPRTGTIGRSQRLAPVVR